MSPDQQSEVNRMFVNELVNSLAEHFTMPTSVLVEGDEENE